MRHRIGIVGCGSVLPTYMATFMASEAITIVALADAERESTRRAAALHGLPAMSFDELLRSDAELIVCLTPPQSHHQIGLRTLEAGKHFYTEKPLAATFSQARQLVDTARRKGLRAGSAPDTFFGAAAQSARDLIDQGVVGAVLYGTAHCMSHGPDHWHPDPAFFYRPGAGPLLDVGIYPVTHLVHHIGPVALVTAQAHVTCRERTVPMGPRAGQRLRVEVPTHVVATLRFEAGPVVELVASFDVWKHKLSPIELYGEDGTLLLDDPNCFGGTTRYSLRDGPWLTAESRKPYRERKNRRGLGVIDMLAAIDCGADHRCNETLALHVIEVLEACLASAAGGQAIELTTRCERPAVLTAALP